MLSWSDAWWLLLNKLALGDMLLGSKLPYELGVYVLYKCCCWCGDSVKNVSDRNWFCINDVFRTNHKISPTHSFPSPMVHLLTLFRFDILEMVIAVVKSISKSSDVFSSTCVSLAAVEAVVAVAVVVVVVLVCSVCSFVIAPSPTADSLTLVSFEFCWCRLFNTMRPITIMIELSKTKRAMLNSKQM